MPVVRSTKSISQTRSKPLTQLTLTGAKATPNVAATKPKAKPKKSSVPGRIEFVELISKREKNHEYRKYKLKDSVERMWVYETAPVQAITHIACIGTAKVPGEVNDPTGVGNDDFDAGKKQSKFGYPVRGLYRLKEPISSDKLKSKYGLSPPQRFFYASKELMENNTIEEQEVVF